MKQVGSVVWPKLRVLQVYGANTGVGKTIFSSVLCRAFKKRLEHVNYLKPVSTGPLNEADDRHISAVGSHVRSKCLFQFDEPISPHLAPVSDAAVLDAVYDELKKTASHEHEAISIVETAGGVLSPAPSGSSQADLYRPLRLPTLLVGDYNLGGIGTTISAWESLHLRGYDVDSIALFAEEHYGNYAYLKDYFQEKQVTTFAIPPPPTRLENADADMRAMREYYDRASEHPDVRAFSTAFLEKHDTRIKNLRAMPEEADRVIWHPFMQHTERSKDTIMAWDSAYGDHFQSYSTKHDAEASSHAPSQSILRPAFDGSASWWTQGLGHGNPRLALTAANAAGRYGHVMFANAVHQPALELAQTIIQKSGNPRLAKVFYSDNGSTGMEVAVKMALRAAAMRYCPNHGTRDLDIRILGLKNSYHGDTIGTMDCSEPSIFNEKVEWYSGRGIWLDFPTIKMRHGKWLVEPFDGCPIATRHFDGLADVFDFERRTADHELYTSYLRSTLRDLVAKTGASIGALIIEPVLLGAGGMLFADPLYQRCLVEVARELYGRADSPSWAPSSSSPSSSLSPLDWKSMPVIFDEVFTGLYRLGRFSAASFLGVHPDIVVNAKLLTGGLLPLCTTTASDSIFSAFLSQDKTDALLHGHSYTAHPVGCALAVDSLRQLRDLDSSAAWTAFREDWERPEAWSMWSREFVQTLSNDSAVESVFTLGSVLALSLRDPAGGTGYASTAATGLRDALLHGSAEGEGDAVVHSRVLGNVLYLMCAPTTPFETIQGVERSVLAVLGRM